MIKTGYVLEPLYCEHNPGLDHPERPRRLEILAEAAAAGDWGKGAVRIPAAFATLEDIELIHAPSYIERIMDTAGEARRYLDPDTVTSARTCEAAFLAAGGVFAAIDSVLAGEFKTAFALVRPPGHHGERDRPMGFCIFNNTALGAAYAIHRKKLERILIVDWDVHHPNATQHSFEDDPRVLLFSTHREAPFFPGTGYLDEVGRGDGRGFTINVPLSVRQGNADFAALYSEILMPVALEYKPQLVLVSAGFDAHEEDPVGGMRLTAAGFARLTDLVMHIAEKTCGGKIVFILEGGYDLVSLKHSVQAVFDRLQGQVKYDFEAMAQHERRALDGYLLEVISQVKKVHWPFWRSLE